MADHPLRPATDRSLGRPLPHQLANRTRAHPRAINLSPLPGAYGISHRFQRLFRTPGQVPTRYSPVRHSRPKTSVRLACVRPAASVRSEPGSNSQVRSPDQRQTPPKPSTHKRQTPKTPDIGRRDLPSAQDLPDHRSPTTLLSTAKPQQPPKISRTASIAPKRRNHNAARASLLSSTQCQRSIQAGDNRTRNALSRHLRRVGPQQGGNFSLAAPSALGNAARRYRVAQRHASGARTYIGTTRASVHRRKPSGRHHRPSARNSSTSRGGRPSAVPSSSRSGGASAAAR